MLKIWAEKCCFWKGRVVETGVTELKEAQQTVKEENYWTLDLLVEFSLCENKAVPETTVLNRLHRSQFKAVGIHCEKPCILRNLLFIC